MEERLTSCCGAEFWLETDICSECKEHADEFIDDEEERGCWMYHNRRDEEAENGN